jgi:uncharacterized protein (TIGR03032 family)
LGEAKATPQQPAAESITVSCSRGFTEWLLSRRVGLTLTSYRSGRLYLVGVMPNGNLSWHERRFDRAMGLVAQPQRLYLASHWQLWRLENVLRPDEATDTGFDRLFVPRNAQTTGDLDVHEIGLLADGTVVLVNTLYSCLATLSATHSFRPLWKPPFISRLAPEDRCHLNGLAMAEGRPRYATAACHSDVVDGWRHRRADGGCLLDIGEDRVVCEGLSMPHSPRLHRGRLWLLNSGEGQLGFVEPQHGRFEPLTFLPGFLRGLAFAGGHAVVGLSLPRDQSFAGLGLDQELRRRDADPWCGLQVVDLRNGDVVQWLRIEGLVRELFDVGIIAGTRCPGALGLQTSEIQTLRTIEEPADPASQL